ncbi:Cof-type HAD-IIB family hydrolase [Lapidilactobacillus bayanensis]|uniref:Cof-type HAD-IIB family hydrolase n=1 Tax=Lapidilactobacillus bayanensis TaxID=2485998 RepID=UPI000F765E12|nr:Cof-type HAD-IIB family hydrolase [Lapidilactobacillus bayanensis]
MIKLFATDMDGTFLRDDKSYDQEKFAQLHEQMLAKNIRWVVASGNQYYQLKSFFADYPNTIYVAENGAYIRDLDQIYALHAYTSEQVTAILAKLALIPQLKILVCGQKSAYALNTTDPDFITLSRQYYYRLTLVDCFAEIDDQIIKFALSCPDDQTETIVARLREDLQGLAEPTSSGRGDIDVIQVGVHKAAGLSELGTHLGIDLSEMCAFGDGGNDLEMVREVGTGVAMANAQADVKAVADVLTGDNNS